MRYRKAAAVLLAGIVIAVFPAACSPGTNGRGTGAGTERQAAEEAGQEEEETRQAEETKQETKQEANSGEGTNEPDMSQGREPGEKEGRETGTADEESLSGREEAEDGGSTDREQTAYRAEIDTVDWDIDSYETFFINGDQTGFIAIQGTQDRSSAVHWLKLISADGQETKIQLSVAGNHVIREADMNEDGIYTLSAASPTADNPGGYWLTGMEKDGTLRFSVSLDELAEGENPYYKSLTLDPEGLILLSEYSGKQIYGFLRDGSEAFRLEGAKVGGLVQDRDGRIYGTGLDSEGQELLLHPVTKEGIGEPLIIEVGSIKGIYPGIEGDFLLQAGERLKEYNIETEALTEVCDLVNFGVDRLNLQEAAGIGDGRAVLVICAPMSAACEVVRLEKGGDADWEKPLITVASLAADFLLREQIRLFNRSGGDFRVVLKEYYDETSPDMTKEDALTRLNADLIDGTAGDLLDFTSLDGIAVRASYVQKGIVEDLYPWMERDGEFQKEDYLQSLFTANEIDGKLYNLVPYFRVTTLIGRSSQVGEGFSWNMEQMQNALQSGMTLAGEYGRESFLYEYCLYYLQGEQRWEALADPSFVSVLEFAKALPEEGTDSDLLGLYRNQILLCSGGIDGKVSGITYARALMGEEISLIGFPVAKGVGSSFSDSMSLGLCSASSNKESAWDFLKAMMSGPYQGMEDAAEFRRTVLPANNAAREERYQYLCGLDSQEGIGITDENGENIWWEIPELTETDTEQAEELMSLITTVREFDPMIWQIIWEEANQYFADRCSAGQAAENMQGRVSLYRMENGG